MRVYDDDHSTRFEEKKKRGTRFNRGISRNRTNEARTNEAIVYYILRELEIRYFKIMS